MGDEEKQLGDVLISELNAMALAANLAELRTHYDERLLALENDVATMRDLIQKQTQVIGDTIQRVMGSGSTVKE